MSLCIFICTLVHERNCFVFFLYIYKTEGEGELLSSGAYGRCFYLIGATLSRARAAPVSLDQSLALSVMRSHSIFHHFITNLCLFFPSLLRLNGTVTHLTHKVQRERHYYPALAQSWGRRLRRRVCQLLPVGARMALRQLGKAAGSCNQGAKVSHRC